MRVGLKIDLAFLMRFVRFVDRPVSVEDIWRRGRGLAPILEHSPEIDTQDNVTKSSKTALISKEISNPLGLRILLIGIGRPSRSKFLRHFS